jgi:peptidoglycan hydrolase-like protein with peptidoglycan-binding domain
MGRKTTNRYFAFSDLLNYTPKHKADVEQNHYPYTGDIGLGNSFDQYGTGPGDRNNGHYVCFIHSSLKLAGIIQDIPSPPGRYTEWTAKKVREFQQKYKLAFVDGVVDSETKSAFSYLWSATKETGSYQKSLEEIEKDYKNHPNFKASVLKYVEATMLADHVGSAKRGQISRISYTDSRLSPDNIEGQFYIAIPDSCLGKEIKSIKIRTGKVCGCTIKGIHFTEADYNANLGQENYETLWDNRTKNLTPKGAVTLIRPGSTETISVEGIKDGHKYKYVRLLVEGSSFVAAGSTTDGGYVPTPNRQLVGVRYEGTGASRVRFDIYSAAPFEEGPFDAPDLGDGVGGGGGGGGYVPRRRIVRRARSSSDESCINF